MNTRLDRKGYQEFLMEELKSRQRQNPRFSLRSFAKFLSLSPSQLSQLISGKRNLTPRQALKIAERLGLSRHQVQTLLSPFEDLSSRESRNFREINESEFSLISDWTYYAILSLGKTAGNKADPQWIAHRLGISEEEAARSFQRLIHLEYVQLTRNGGFRQSTKPLTISSRVGSEVIRNFHKKNLRIAAEKIDSVPTNLRDFSSITLAFHPQKLEKARAMIAEFRRAFSAEMELGEKNSVYTLAIQFYPLTEVEKG